MTTPLGNSDVLKLFDITLGRLQGGFDELCTSVPQPKAVRWGDGYAFRYAEKTASQALILKLARLLSSLHASKLLLMSGFLQELGVLQRIMDEVDADILFLSGPLLYGNKEPRHDQFLDEFFAEEFDIPGDPLASAQKRHRVPRDKIRAYNARTYQGLLSVSDIVAVTETIEKAYSGYIHAAAVHTLDMYGGLPPKFHVAGIPSRDRRNASMQDLMNYFYRAIGSTCFAAKALGDDALSMQLYEFSKQVSEQTGIDQWDGNIRRRKK